MALMISGPTVNEVDSMLITCLSSPRSSPSPTAATTMATLLSPLRNTYRYLVRVFDPRARSQPTENYLSTLI